MHKIVTRMARVWLGAAFVVGLFPLFAWASGGQAETGHHGAGILLLWISIILLGAKLTSVIEKWKQPSVLGELLWGVLLGNVALFGLTFFEPIGTNEIMRFLAEFGVVLLLFQTGMESNVREMLKVGLPAFLVAIIGVAVPFGLALWITPLLLPGLDQNTYLFAGAALVATSVSIPARIFKDLGQSQTRAAKVILGAAVIDDVLGLIVLATVSAIVQEGSVTAGSVSLIFVQAVAFLVGAIVIGQLLAPRLGTILSKIHTGVGMKLILALSFGLVVAYLAEMIGLAPIVGAFAAGLVLDPIHFRSFDKPEFVEDVEAIEHHLDAQSRSQILPILERHAHAHIEDLLKPLAFFFVPIFFVITGMSVDLSTLFDPQILIVALAITFVAFVGKLVAGIAAGRKDAVIVGVGMAPRGEVGLIFATVGQGLGVVPDNVFSVIIIMVMLTTLITPIALNMLLRRRQAREDSLTAQAA